MDNQAKLKEIIRRAQEGDFRLDDLIGRSPISPEGITKDAQRAANIQEDALGRLALEQYKGKVPNKPSNDFLEGLREQFAPDVKDRLTLDPEIKGYLGQFLPDNGININPRQSPEQMSGTLVHELLHSRDYSAGDFGDQYDIPSGRELNKRLGELAPESVMESGYIKYPEKLKKALQESDLDQVKEILLRGHHGLKRGATIARANLPRLLKGLPILGVAGAALMNPEDASAAVPGLSEAEDVGESPEEEKMMLAEDTARKAYQKSPAKMARLKALIQNGKNK